MCLVVRTHLTLYDTFQSPIISVKKLLGHVKWCEICNEENWKYLEFNKRLPS